MACFAVIVFNFTASAGIRTPRRKGGGVWSGHNCALRLLLLLITLKCHNFADISLEVVGTLSGKYLKFSTKIAISCTLDLIKTLYFTVKSTYLYLALQIS